MAIETGRVRSFSCESNLESCTLVSWLAPIKRPNDTHLYLIGEDSWPMVSN